LLGSGLAVVIFIACLSVAHSGFVIFIFARASCCFCFALI